MNHKFNVDKNGIYYVSEDAPIWIASNIQVKALVRDSASENWGRLLEFQDSDGVIHRWSMPMEILKGNGEELRSELLRLGLEISPNPKARSLLLHYIISAKPDARVRCVNRMGWFNQSFVLPHKTIGKNSDEVLFQAEKINCDYKEQGTLEDWQSHVSKLCVGNSRLVFSVSSAFAAMLLGLINQESGGIHFVGESSTGKTTALRVAASVYGGQDYLTRWRATTNGLEALAANRSDTLLVLDELSQVDPNEAGSIAYMLANGTGKTRANASGNSGARNEWRLLFISSGEVSLSQHMLSVGKRSKAGQEIRLVDIPTDGGNKLGIFEYLHGYNSGAEFSKALLENTQKYYGTALIAFLQIITNPIRWEQNIKTLKAQMKNFVSNVLPQNSSGQVIRVCERFALIAAAGELATFYGITKWKASESENAAKRCFKDWLSYRGTNGDQERESIISQFKSFFEINAESRFSNFDSKFSSAVVNRAGFRKKVPEGYEYYLFSKVFGDEIFKDFNRRFAAKVLADVGLIQLENDKTFTCRVYLPGLGQTRCFKILMRLNSD